MQKPLVSKFLCVGLDQKGVFQWGVQKKSLVVLGEEYCTYYNLVGMQSMHPTTIHLNLFHILTKGKPIEALPLTNELSCLS